MAAGTLVGVWFGFHAATVPLAVLTATAGAVAGVNLTLILFDLWRVRSSGVPPSSAPVDVRSPEPATQITIGMP